MIRQEKWLTSGSLKLLTSSLIAALCLTHASASATETNMGSNLIQITSTDPKDLLFPADFTFAKGGSMNLSNGSGTEAVFPWLTIGGLNNAGNSWFKPALQTLFSIAHGDRNAAINRFTSEFSFAQREAQVSNLIIPTSELPGTPSEFHMADFSGIISQEYGASPGSNPSKKDVQIDPATSFLISREGLQRGTILLGPSIDNPDVYISKIVIATRFVSTNLIAGNMVATRDYKTMVFAVREDADTLQQESSGLLVKASGLGTYAAQHPDWTHLEFVLKSSTAEDFVFQTYVRVPVSKEDEAVRKSLKDISTNENHILSDFIGQFLKGYNGQNISISEVTQMRKTLISLVETSAREVLEQRLWFGRNMIDDIAQELNSNLRAKLAKLTYDQNLSVPKNFQVEGLGRLFEQQAKKPSLHNGIHTHKIGEIKIPKKILGSANPFDLAAFQIVPNGDHELALDIYPKTEGSSPEEIRTHQTLYRVPLKVEPGIHSMQIKVNGDASLLSARETHPHSLAVEAPREIRVDGAKSNEVKTLGNDRQAVIKAAREKAAALKAATSCATLPKTK